MSTEIDLIKSARNGSRRGFKKLYNINVSRLYRFLYQFSNDKDTVDEWVQRAFIKAFNNIDSFKGDSKFSTWLFKIGINEMRSDINKKNHLIYEEIDDKNYAGTEAEYKIFEWEHDMKWLLSELDPVKKAIFILFEVEGYTHYEISEMLGISEASSRTTLSRTKSLLRTRWISQGV